MFIFCEVGREESLELNETGGTQCCATEQREVEKRLTEPEYLEMGSGNLHFKIPPPFLWILPPQKKFKTAEKLKEGYNENPCRFHLDSPAFSIYHIHCLTVCHTHTHTTLLNYFENICRQCYI